MTDPMQNYYELLEKVDAFWRRAVESQPEAFTCHAGCASCCQPELTVFPVEAAAIAWYLANLPRELRREAWQQREAQGAEHPASHCRLLSDERCLIYPMRPIICRTHGLALRQGERVTHCPLNYAEADPLPDAVLDLEQINTLLVLVNRLYLEGHHLPPDSPRVPLASLLFPQRRAR